MNKQILTAITLMIVLSGFLGGCKKEDSEKNKNSSNPGYIFLRWDREDGCTTCAVKDINDGNSGFPANPTRGTFYGPCPAGDYDGTFNASSTQPAYSGIIYSLASPPEGYNRYYTFILWQFSVPLNRWVTSPYGDLGNNLTYTDVACSGTCSSGTGGGGGGGGGGSGGGCTNPYSSPTPNDAQLDALCQSAYVYRCGGYDSQADLSCAQYQQLAATGTNVPPCPSCP